MIRIKSYAKINLGLRVVSRREDGYHNLSTLFQRISLADELTLFQQSRMVSYRGPRVTKDPEQNLCVRSARLIQSLFGSQKGIHILMKKNIPVGSGLGGGSSNAAAVILGMLKLYDINISKTELLSIGLEIGSDVPFFLMDVPAAYGEGRGEQLTEVSGLNTHKKIVVLFNKISISTSEAFKSMSENLTNENNSIILQNCVICKYDGENLPTEIINDFESVVFSKYPDLSQARDNLKNAGAEYAGLSGSGSAIFGIFNDLDAVREALEQVPHNWRKFICNPL